MRLPSAQRSLKFILVLICGAWLASFVADTTFVAADHHVFREAGDALYETGDPYAANPPATRFESHYRYPPLLAMLMPVLPAGVWFPLLALAWATPLWLGWRRSGADGLLLPLLLAGCWIQQLLNGNSQGFIVAALCLVPVSRRGGAVATAAATWVKIHPIFVVLWYLGRRDWTALRWFGGTFVVLGLIQLPWLGEFLAYATSPQASVPAQLSLRASGPVVWLLGVSVLSVLTLRHARDEKGWFLLLVTQIAALPRVNLLALTLLLPPGPPARPTVERAHASQQRMPDAPAGPS
jgi:hypothetical protein